MHVHVHIHVAPPWLLLVIEFIENGFNPCFGSISFVPFLFIITCISHNANLIMTTHKEYIIVYIILFYSTNTCTYAFFFHFLSHLIQSIKSSISIQSQKKDSVLSSTDQLLAAARSPDEAREIQLRLENIKTHWENLAKRIENRLVEMKFERKQTVRTCHALIIYTLFLYY